MTDRTSMENDTENNITNSYKGQENCREFLSPTPWREKTHRKGGVDFLPYKHRLIYGEKKQVGYKFSLVNIKREKPWH